MQFARHIYFILTALVWSGRTYRLSTQKHWSVILISKFYHLWLSRQSCPIIELGNIKNHINSKTIFVFVKFVGDFEYRYRKCHRKEPRSEEIQQTRNEKEPEEQPKRQWRREVSPNRYSESCWNSSATWKPTWK